MGSLAILVESNRDAKPSQRIPRSGGRLVSSPPGELLGG